MGNTSIIEAQIGTPAVTSDDAVTRKALVLDANKNITNINTINAATVNGIAFGVQNFVLVNRFSTWTNSAVAKSVKLWSRSRWRIVNPSYTTTKKSFQCRTT
ncbi:hypothetical protein P3T76_007018 [Phytophthora citrophthora]|uniref:Uncharacterized protein n=1 Tax=Phytophthora citrophthora TaxID=4793 RepID=A0AAD9LMU4_9STRA|nr:hypothetical protein P3T76_007018 [Phytophthora citrophthora]